MELTFFSLLVETNFCMKSIKFSQNILLHSQEFIQAFTLSTVFVLKIQFYKWGIVASVQVLNSWGSGGAVSPLVGVKGASAPFLYLDP